MEQRQRSRERIPEREQRLHNYAFNEERAERSGLLSRLFKEAPRVVKTDDMPWEQVYQSYHKILTGSNLPNLEKRLKQAPIYHLVSRLQLLETGHKNGNHRHYPEALFFILEGKGHEVHDDVRWDWEGGDLVLVPPYSIHQHFCDEGPARIFFCVGEVANQWGLGGAEQFEAAPEFVMPEGSTTLYDADGNLAGYRSKDGLDVLFRAHAVGRENMARRKQMVEPSHEVTDLYEYYIRLFEEEVHWRQTVPQVIRQRDRQWMDTRNGRILWYTHPQLTTGLRTFEVYLQEIPPGGRSGKHHHVGEELHFIVEGSGYEVIDGERYDWDTNDLVCIPVLTTHQSFNRDPHHPARFLSVKSRHYDNLGFGGIEHFEDASG
jgi:gentisate 1,2-dioxygenase